MGARTMDDAARRKELAAFLRARRAELKPGDVGLPDGVNRRRTPGLRREEVAQLSGVGLTWYTWLEQGRAIPASRQVIDALATALRLGDEHRRHLFVLASLSLPPAPGDDKPVLAAVQRMLDAVKPNPAYIIDHRFDVLAWNAAQSALWLDFAEIPEDERNLVLLLFRDPGVRRLLLDWDETARMIVAQFRAAAGQYPGDPRFAQVVDRLSRDSTDFLGWWESYPVAEFSMAVNRLAHPRAGALELDLSHLRLVEHPQLTMVLQTPVHDADARALSDLLAAVT
ncbi:helix-turn-helix transcriptional regulator [Micromonospora sp. SCSIO 07396]|uniref:Helix-turn-helix domain-containing protein n=3 Tax=Micromonosporaceae TaxID=28056 RepID=A0ABS2J5E3_9ACTN|nr:helix-turn-helix domain-containing protein [Micromonospora humidisoli]